MRSRISRADIATATKWAACFTTATRDNGDEFVKHTDDAPDALRNACMHAHGGMLPDDHRYQMIVSALHTIADAEPRSDAFEIASDFGDSEPGIYTSEQCAWLMSNNRRSGYVGDAVENMGVPNPFRITDCIAMGWAEEAREVFWLVLQSVQNADATTDDESEDDA